MPRVDGIGVSSAGVFIGNAPMVSSIFIKVPRSRREEVKTDLSTARQRNSAMSPSSLPMTVMCPHWPVR